MPRKSLPIFPDTQKTTSLLSRSQSTLKRSAPQTTQTRFTPSRTRHQKSSPDPIALVEEVKKEEEDPEKELEAWQDFAAEHYEMVEQLPLELHRNFRLLRELDEGCAAQTDKLQALIRLYISQRLAPPKPIDETIHPNGAEKGNGEDVEMAESAPTILPDPAPDEPALSRETAEEMGIPQSDGAGGLVLPPPPVGDQSEAEIVEQVEPRHEFPHLGKPGEPSTMRTTPHLPNSHSRPHHLLPEIGRLGREIVRSGEEKVAVAVGAYNSIDRHIRALDSALSAQEASILLGLRPATLPSSAVDEFWNGPADEDALEGEGVDGEITIGLGGGGGRKGRKGKKGRKGQVEEPSKQEATNGYPPVPSEIEIDPNEPKYCYCHQVSYGQMIGCENDECPHEWFHLGCVGLPKAPTGRWWCNTCRPKVGLGMGGAGSIQPKTMIAAGRGRKK